MTHPFPFVPIPPLLDQFCDAFGPDRLMWGGDYPPVSIREEYANALRFDGSAGPAGATPAERIFGETAAEGVSDPSLTPERAAVLSLRSTSTGPLGFGEIPVSVQALAVPVAGWTLAVPRVTLSSQSRGGVWDAGHMAIN